MVFEVIVLSSDGSAFQALDAATTNALSAVNLECTVHQKPIVGRASPGTAWGAHKA